jgi:diaminopimelate epimerase
MKIKFTKLHGLGNDYLYIDATKQDISDIDLSKLSIRMSERNFGIGSDGIILIEKSKKAMFKMRIFNADGSEAEMCGNGIRGFAKYIYDHKLAKKKKIDVETKAGIIVPEIIKEKDGKAELIRVDMGEPKLERKDMPMLGNKDEQIINEKLEAMSQLVRVTCVSMGNPHCILFVEDYNFDYKRLGKSIEKNERFPRKTNVEFVKVINDKEIDMRVWERGSGETLACGTGASASVVASVLNKKTGRDVTVHLLGGDLQIEWDKATNHVFMTGPAEEVFSGTFEF